MSTFTQRLGNIIAWATFAVLIASVSLVVPLIIEVVDYQQHLKQIDWERNVQEQPSLSYVSGHGYGFSCLELRMSEATEEQRELAEQHGFEESKCESNVYMVNWDDGLYWIYAYSKPTGDDLRRKFRDLDVGYQYTRERRFEDEWLVSVVFSAALWGCLLVAQYLFYGSVRVLPWKP